MMELQRADATAVPADHARAAGLRDQNRLDLTPSPGDTFLPAAQAAVCTTPLQPERGPPVHLEVELRLWKALRQGLAALPAMMRAPRDEAILQQPVANGGRREPGLRSYLANGKALVNQGRELSPRKPAATGVLAGVHGGQAVLLDPVTDGRLVAAEAPAYLCK